MGVRIRSFARYPRVPIAWESGGATVIGPLSHLLASICIAALCKQTDATVTASPNANSLDHLEYPTSQFRATPYLMETEGSVISAMPTHLHRFCRQPYDMSTRNSYDGLRRACMPPATADRS
jgi:hypothetical protein